MSKVDFLPNVNEICGFRGNVKRDRHIVNNYQNFRDGWMNSYWTPLTVRPFTFNMVYQWQFTLNSFSSLMNINFVTWAVSLPVLNVSIIISEQEFSVRKFLDILLISNGLMQNIIFWRDCLLFNHNLEILVKYIELAG